LNNVVDVLTKPFRVLVLSALLSACSEQESIPQVDPTIRIDTAVLEGHETIGHDALLPENFYFIGVGHQYKTIDYIPKHQALLKYLEKATSFQFKILYSAKGQNAAEMLGDDQVQFAMVDAIGLVNAANEYGAEPLVRESAFEKRSVFVVKNNSPIRSLKSVNKESLALSVKGSLEGDLKPRVMLKEVGFLLPDIKGAYYADSPASCLEDVIKGDVSICALEEGLVATDLKNGTLRVLQRSLPYQTYGVANNIYVDSEVVKFVQQALLDYEQGSYVAADTEMFNRLLRQVAEFDLRSSRD